MSLSDFLFAGTNSTQLSQDRAGGSGLVDRAEKSAGSKEECKPGHFDHRYNSRQR